MSSFGRAGYRGLVFGLAALCCGATLGFGQGEAAAPAGSAAKPTVRLHLEGSGRFEVLSLPGAEGVRLAGLAEAAWAEWMAPLGLPSRLPVAITVRLVPKADWIFGNAPTRVAADPGGVVSVWILSEEGADLARERLWLTALAEGALRRKTFLLGVDPAKAQPPTWLTVAAAEAVIVARQASMQEAWQEDFGKEAKPAKLRDVLLWRFEGDAEGSLARARASYGVWLWLRDESGKSGAWERFVAAVAGGESSGAALAREFKRLTPRPTEALEWELAWKVAAARLVLARPTPQLSAEASRQWLERLSRIVVTDLQTGGERVLPPWGEWASRQEEWPKTTRAERAGIIDTGFSRIHPFYLNAASSLGRAWSALTEGKESAWREASVAWASDMADGRALENASRRLLDDAERR